ncbi:MAG: bifunctional hydroxymethylpyrimidine kinase/phosphomethylpyrimidine kinase [Bryobacteraceae bacterium]|nr:bifunctional hydroxymethylpyrimidine kinase/phosphomethylpyrimidine kinase [Bryobacteraceae bacterium]
MTVAGSDPSGGAGIQADLKTFHQFGVYGEAALTLLTVQNTCNVFEVVCLEPRLVEAQVEAVLADIPPQAAKTGALGNAAIIEAVAALAPRLRAPLVVDPVMISKHGAPLIAEEARPVLEQKLLPRAALVTPNLHEAAALAGCGIRTVEQMEEAARRIFDRTGAAVLIKGGHLEGEAVDVLCWQGGLRRYGAPRFDTRHTHGTGCTYSAAITACLALGLDLPEAVARAKRYITEAIRTNPGLGGGSGPVNHHASTG